MIRTALASAGLEDPDFDARGVLALPLYGLPVHGRKITRALRLAGALWLALPRPTDSGLSFLPMIGHAASLPASRPADGLFHGVIETCAS